jgi:penicillin-binding protein-related factor A (putative recombinase)
MKDAEGKLVTRPIQSLPDFEGVTIDGVQFVFDCKVCSGASFPLNNSHFAERQLRHLLTRADFGATCFLMLHFNERELTKRTVAAATYAFPVHREHPFWLEYFRGEVKSVGRLDCEQHGMTVWWREPDRCRVARPDILSAVDMIRSSRSLIEA